MGNYLNYKYSSAYQQIKQFSIIKIVKNGRKLDSIHAHKPQTLQNWQYLNQCYLLLLVFLNTFWCLSRNVQIWCKIDFFVLLMQFSICLTRCVRPKVYLKLFATCILKSQPRLYVLNINFIHMQGIIFGLIATDGLFIIIRLCFASHCPANCLKASI